MSTVADGIVAAQLSRAVLARQATVDAPSDTLTSPRFVGEPLLEACFEDRARMTVGERDTDDAQPVSKVQQALVDLGFDPGSSGPAGDGVDGVYGPKTAAAVREFKRRERLGFEQFGDVGPGTMHRLNELFPPERPGPGPEPTPVDDEDAGIDVPGVEPPDPGPLILAFDPTSGGPSVLDAGGGLGVGDDTKGRRLPFQNSLHETIFLITRWMHTPTAPFSEQQAAAATTHLLEDPDTVYRIKDAGVCQTPSGVCRTSRAQYEEWVRLKEKFVDLDSGAIAFLCRELGVPRQEFEAAVAAQEKLGTARDQLDLMEFFNRTSVPLDPQASGAESRKGREKRMPIQGNDALLANPQIAKLYLALMKSKVGLTVDESALHPEAGLTLKDVASLATDPKRRLLTDLFTQGVKEYRDAGGTDIAGGFILLESSLWDQVLWGNPTAVRNELMVGVGKPERSLGIGLVFKYDGILYYDPQGNPMPGFSGSGFRDPGFKGTAKDPGFINLDTISDETLRGFLKFLHDSFKTPTLIIGKGAEAYWKNLEDINEAIRHDLSDAVKDELENALEILIGFLLWRATAAALVRQPHPWLKAIGAGMEVLAEGAGYVLQIEFIGSTEQKLVTAGFHLAKVVPKNEKGEMDEISKLELEVAAGIIRPMVAEIAAMLIIAAGEKVAKGPKPKAKAELESIARGGKRAKLRCTFCELVAAAAEFTQSFFREMYEDARVKTGAKEGSVVRSPDFKSVELHPDGSVYGDHGELTKMLNQAKLSGRRGSRPTTFESHHLMEDNQMEAFGVPRNKGRAVALDSSDHSTVSAWMRGLLNRRTVTDIDELYDLHREMYHDNGHPEFAEEMTKFLKQWKDVIAERYRSGRVPGSRRADFSFRQERALKFLERF